MLHLTTKCNGIRIFAYRAPEFVATPLLLGVKCSAIPTPVHSRCDARPTVTFPAVGHRCRSAGTKLYCLMTEAHVCALVNFLSTGDIYESCHLQTGDIRTYHR